jgi:hypothetical protein
MSSKDTNSILRDGKYFACPRERARAESRARYQVLLDEKRIAEMSGQSFGQENELRQAAADIAAADAIPRVVECGMPKCSKHLDMDVDEYVMFPVPFAKHRRGRERMNTWHFGGETHYFEKIVCAPCWHRFHAEVTGRAGEESEE